MHIQNPHKNSRWSLAGCIGCCNVLSAATKLQRLALCAFIVMMNLRSLTFAKNAIEKNVNERVFLKNNKERFERLLHL